MTQIKKVEPSLKLRSIRDIEHHGAPDNFVEDLIDLHESGLDEQTISNSFFDHFAFSFSDLRLTNRVKGAMAMLLRVGSGSSKNPTGRLVEKSGGGRMG